MTTSEKNIDQLIRDALSEQETELYDELAEQGVIDQAFAALSGRNKALKMFMMIIATIFFGLSMYSAVQFFASEATKDLILWASCFFFFFMGTTAIKVFWWMEMEKNATVREIKRVELQLAHLTATIKTRAANNKSGES